MHRLPAFALCIAATFNFACAPPVPERMQVTSNISPDESVVFFRTAGWFDVSKNLWQVPIHGWIHEPEDSTVRKAFFARILERQFGLVPDAETAQNFSRRFNLLIADNERGKRIVINLAGQDIELPTSKPNGHFAATLGITVAQADRYARNGVIGFAAVTGDDEFRRFSGEAQLIPPTGLSVISDIDDTVKITEVVNRKKLLENTFLLDFVAAPGMAELFGRWIEPGVSLHYVSSSPWQLYDPLQEFLNTNRFPPATLNLKSVRFRDETILDLFKKGTETKPVVIERILATYRGRSFVLVGDSGEQDPEVYADVLRNHTDQIRGIYIRNVTGESPDNERFSAAFQGVDRRLWQLFDEPGDLARP